MGSVFRATFVRAVVRELVGGITDAALRAPLWFFTVTRARTNSLAAYFFDRVETYWRRDCSEAGTRRERDARAGVRGCGSHDPDR
jgi:hypothetical protein